MKFLKTFFIAVIITAVYIPHHLTAQDNPVLDEKEILIENTASSAESTPPSLNNFTLLDFLRMISILGIVILVIYIFFSVLKKAAGPKFNKNSLIKVISTQMLGNNRYVHLIETGRQIFLVGSAESGVSLVSEIIDKEAKDEIMLYLSENEEPQKKRFSDVIFGLINPSLKEKPLKRSVNDTIDFIRKQKNRLNKL